MRIIKATAVFLFLTIILVPIFSFNFQSNAISAIDNRMLTENPFSSETLEDGGDLTDTVQNYVNDRIGFRDSMILAYTLLNDRVFGKMVHPSYTYGKDGYVFGEGITTVSYAYSDFHEAFADMVLEIQNYCTERGIPFLFVFNPAKPAVLTQYLPDGINYDRSWVDDFLAALDARQVHYIDNTDLLIEKTEYGEVVFDQKYDANHWNDLGAYYGCNAILEELKKDLPAIHLTQPSEMEVGQALQTSLPVSQFPIYELVPDITISMQVTTDRTALYDEELERDPSYTAFTYYQNVDRIEEGAPKVLVFQGSYMNNFGYQYLANGFGEYISVHDYQNVLDFSYYYNIFQPDAVIFEVAEYTFYDIYFDYDSMSQFVANPSLSAVEAETEALEEQPLVWEQLTVEEGSALTKIYWNTDLSFEAVWLCLDEEYDMKTSETGYVVTVPTVTYRQYQTFLSIAAYRDSVLRLYQ